MNGGTLLHDTKFQQGKTPSLGTAQTLDTKVVFLERRIPLRYWLVCLSN